MTLANRHSRLGASLIEMLAYIAVLGVVVNTAVGAFTSSSRLFAHGVTTLDRVHAFDELRRDFRREVRTSSEVVEKFEDYRTGPDMVVLRGGSGEEERYVIFGKLAGDGRVSKLVLAGGEGHGPELAGGPQLEQFVTYNLDWESVAFEYAPWRVSLLLVPDRDGRKGAKQELRITATLRGITP